MRIDVTPLQADLIPGVAQPITITLSNTETVIAGYSIRILGADPEWVEIDSDDVALFPDESRVVTALINPPKGIPAGTRRVAVQVRELTPPYSTNVTEIDLAVPEAPGVQVRIDPLAITAGKRAGFGLLVENTGNTPIKGYLSGDDPEEKVRFDFDPERIALAPGQHAIADMRASARRHFLGAPIVRTLSVYLDEVPDDVFFNPVPDGPPTAAEERTPRAEATFVQRSVMSRSALSLLGLLFAATVFAIVITVALSRLVAQTTADRDLALQVAAARNSSAATGTSGVAGTVILLTTHKPVPGVSVSVFTASNTTVPITTTATNSQGVYSVTDLPAGQYKISFRGAGFVELWYPGAASDSDAATITLAPGQVKGGLDVDLGGVPATIQGTVVGDDVSAATLYLETVPRNGTTTATARTQPLGQNSTNVTPPNNGGAIVQQVPVGSDGSFALSNVPSPSVYNLVVAKTGYATTTQRIDIGAGEDRTGIKLTLKKGDGLISGTITSQAGPLPDVTVTASSGQQTTSTVSLTGAQAGRFTLRDLPTPASFTVIARRGGFASQTVTLSLSAGQKLTGVSITLSRSSASLRGVVTVLPGNVPAPGVTVTVTGGQTTAQTTTQSTGSVGSWTVGGLPIPGTYTVSFARSDLQPQTVSVSLDASGNVTPGSLGSVTTAGGISVTMQSATATVSGTISQAGAATLCQPGTNRIGEATVTLGSGSTSYSVTSASVAPDCGQFRIDDVQPGTYTMTVSASAGTTPDSQVITVTAGQTLVKNLTLPAAASITGSVVCCTPGSTAAPGVRAGWSVFLYRLADFPTTVAASTVTDARGDFGFKNVDAGEYMIAASPTADPSNAVATARVTVQPSQNRSDVRIVVGQ